MINCTVDTISNNLCAQVNTLASNKNFKSLMTILQQNTGQNYEIGYTYDVNADGTVNVNHFQGSNNSSSVDINIPIPVDGFTHSHYSGDFPTFSGADIQQIYQIMQAGKMKNPNTLTLFEGSSDFTTWEPIINNKVTNTNCNN